MVKLKPSWMEKPSTKIYMFSTFTRTMRIHTHCYAACVVDQLIHLSPLPRSWADLCLWSLGWNCRRCRASRPSTAWSPSTSLRAKKIWSVVSLAQLAQTVGPARCVSPESTQAHLWWQVLYTLTAYKLQTPAKTTMPCAQPAQTLEVTTSASARIAVTTPLQLTEST